MTMENSLKQYVELYDANREAVDGGSCEAMNGLRRVAREVLDKTVLPSRRTPDYEKSPINEWVAPDRGVNVARVEIPVDLADTFRCGVPNMSPIHAFVVNDAYAGTKRDSLPEGMAVMSLGEASVRYPDVVEKCLGKIADINNPLVAFNTLLAQDGVFIHVDAGVRCQRPLQLVNILSAPISLATFRRVLIVLEENASLELLICDHTADNEHDYLVSQVVEVSLARGSRLDVCDIEEASEMTNRISTLTADLDAGSAFGMTEVSLTSGRTRNNFTVNLKGEHAEARVDGMAINSDHRHVDNCTRINHIAPHCHSNQLFKYVLDGESTGAFEGEIHVAGKAQFTEAFQTNRNIIASPTAKMHATPRLLIYNDDVKCSHGATTGQLDNDAIFYMQTRGIPVAEARTMLMQAFMVDVIDNVKIEGIRERLRMMVDKRFGGEEFCRGCNLQKP